MDSSRASAQTPEGNPGCKRFKRFPLEIKIGSKSLLQTFILLSCEEATNWYGEYGLHKIKNKSNTRTHYILFQISVLFQTSV